MSRFPSLLFLLAFVLQCHGFPGPIWTYAELVASSELVVVAVPVRVETLEETMELPNVLTQTIDGSKLGERRPLRVRGMATTFEVLTVLKGDPSLQCLVLHHYRRAETSGKGFVNGPLFVWFDASEQGRFLAFLVKEKDGRYAPVTGQLYAALSVKRLEPGDGDQIENRCTALKRADR